MNMRWKQIAKAKTLTEYEIVELELLELGDLWTVTRAMVLV